MADQPHDPAREPGPRTPRWAIALGIIALILILLVAAQFLLGLEHGPAIHGLA